MVSKFEARELEINSLKGRRLDEGEEAAERVSDDTEEMVTVLTFMDAASILTSGGVQMVSTAAEVVTATVSIPTGSGVVSTASPTIPTAALIFTTATKSTSYMRRKGKETMVESETPKKKKEYHQFATELPIERRIELISDLVKYQDNYAKVLKYQTQQKPLTRKQQREFYTSVLRNQAGWKAKHFKGMTLEEIKEKFDQVLKEKFDQVWKKIQDFIPIGSKEEAERFKRKGLRLEQESTSEEVKATEEVPEEKVKEMMQLVPVEEIYVEALQVKHPIIDWKELVKETLSVRPATSDKEMEIWVELKRLYEPDVEDQLWTHTQNLMHALVEWKLYDMCGVHHVTSKDIEIFMLVEKDYPLRKGLNMTITRSGMTPEAIKELINRRVEEALAAYEEARAANALEAKNQSQNGSDGDNGNGGNGNENNGNGENGNGENGNGRNENLNENGRGVFGLTRWFEKIETVFHISNYPEKYQVKELMKLMAEVYCPRNEVKKMESELWNMTMKSIDLAAYTQRFQELTMLCTRMVHEEEDRIERYVGGLPNNIKGNVMFAEPTRLQDAIRLANYLIDQKLKGYAVKNVENKRRLEVNQRDNYGQQPPFKRLNVGGWNVTRAYTASNNERKPYNGLLPLCNKCKLHHEGPCTVRCGKCNKVRHLTRGCKVTSSTTST
nr:hypothetical protein [Tanacetum cinerariifolium]